MNALAPENRLEDVYHIAIARGLNSVSLLVYGANVRYCVAFALQSFGINGEYADRFDSVNGKKIEVRQLVGKAAARRKEDKAVAALRLDTNHPDCVTINIGQVVRPDGWPRENRGQGKGFEVLKSLQESQYLVTIPSSFQKSTKSMYA